MREDLVMRSDEIIPDAAVHSRAGATTRGADLDPVVAQWLRDGHLRGKEEVGAASNSPSNRSKDARNSDEPKCQLFSMGFDLLRHVGVEHQAPLPSGLTRLRPTIAS
jgi:hypothetical protein